ncbi:RICIN domain-containing protein [Streptomyces laurentii]|uniref:RICIN domain-containing protein n=1 Tax=Streptomyces laurentii TaxID=39478 RepID=UPI00367637F7
MIRTTIRRAVAAGSVVATAVAATVAVGFGASAAQTGGAPAAAPRPAVRAAVDAGADIAQGGRYRIVSERYEVLDLDQSGTDDGTRIQTWEKNASPAQAWRLWDAGDGGYLAETTVPDGDDMVVDAGVDDGNVSLRRMNGGNGEANQRWTFEPAGGGWFHLRNSARGCLTAGAAEGDQVTVKDCGDDFTQLWCLESAEPPGGPTAEKGIRGEAARRIETNQAPAVRVLADEPTNTDYLIVDVARAQATSRTGMSVRWIGPSQRNPYKQWDWVEVLDGTSRVAWDWVCPNQESQCDGANGSTFLNTGGLPKGKKYTLKYWSDGGRVGNGTLRATAEFVA